MRHFPGALVRARAGAGEPYAIASALSHTAGFVAALAEICVVFVLAPLLVGSHLLAVADSVPVFDVKESCQGREIGAVFAGRNSETCIQSEEAARDQLKKSWGEFPAKDRSAASLAISNSSLVSK